MSCLKYLEHSGHRILSFAESDKCRKLKKILLDTGIMGIGFYIITESPATLFYGDMKDIENMPNTLEGFQAMC